LLFRLREVDEKQLIAQASGFALTKTARPKGRAGKSRIMTGGDLAALFGLDLAALPEAGGIEAEAKPRAARAKKKAR
jgi:hypothetical protein